MTFDVEWKEADFVSAQVAFLRHHPFQLIKGFWYPVAILVIAVVVIANDTSKWKNALVAFAVALALIAFSLLVTRIRWHFRFKRTPYLNAPSQVTLDAEAVKIHVFAQDTIHHWGSFAAVYEASRVFVFETPNNTLVFIPKRNLNSLHIDEVRELCRANAKGTVRMAAAP